MASRKRFPLEGLTRIGQIRVVISRPGCHRFLPERATQDRNDWGSRSAMLVGTIKKPVLQTLKCRKARPPLMRSPVRMPIAQEDAENCRDQRHDLVPATGILVAVCISATWWLVLGVVLLRGL